MKLRLPQIENEQEESILDIKLHYCSDGIVMLSYNDINVLLIDKYGRLCTISLTNKRAEVLKECGVVLNENEFSQQQVKVV